MLSAESTNESNNPYKNKKAMKTKNLSRIIMILMLVLMGSVSAVAQGFKIKKFSYAKSGELLRGDQLYTRTYDEVTWERKNGY